ncbi:uncharacterized protein LOC123709738 [Pieris brassicae]|uniref:Cuticle protein n=1 Tax=Pieris brassicae TaxID=7116 RepID=A0A9P0TF09_PIEBR|nr:uncharacterized protein LOC123709738 [Pieris brassicae]CAH4028677.1 unnamed protein product [Pieris brassicae]
MFKFVAVVAFLAVAAASPDPAIISTGPLAYSTGFAPGLTTYSASQFYNPAPVVYSSPALAYSGNYGYPHFIKKRSLVSSYIASAPLAYAAAPFGTTYGAAPLGATYAAASLASPYATTYSAPLIHSSPVYTTHLIKKRSAPLIVPSASYIAPGAYPAYSAYSAAAPIYSSPYYSSSYYSGSPFAYTQFIKK